MGTEVSVDGGNSLRQCIHAVHFPFHSCHSGDDCLLLCGNRLQLSQNVCKLTQIAICRLDKHVKNNTIHKTHIHKHTHVFTHKHTHAHAYIHTHTHKQTHTYTHTHYGLLCSACTQLKHFYLWITENTKIPWCVAQRDNFTNPKESIQLFCKEEFKIDGVEQLSLYIE